MRLSLATNWDDQLLDNYNEINAECSGQITEVFGSLRNSIVGNARPTLCLPEVSPEEARRHIERAHQHGIKFNYTFNAVCTSGMEYQEEYQKKVLAYLDEVVSMGIDSIVVAIPYYLEMIKAKYPGLQVKVSANSHVDTLNKLKIWEELGADVIVLCDSINRDFPLLKRTLEVSNVELELLTANSCLFHCPYQYYHQGLVCHMSQSEHPMNGVYMDYPVMHCTMEKFSKPENLIRSRWIRPEDVAQYEELGFKRFKIGARQASTEWNTRVARAYASRSYDGNLLEILQGLEPIADIDKKRVEGIGEGQWALFKGGVEAFSDASELLYVDNKKLDGFLEFYKTNTCRYNCIDCKYCKSIADKVISVPDEERLETLLEAFPFVFGGMFQN